MDTDHKTMARIAKVKKEIKPEFRYKNSVCSEQNSEDFRVGI